jgi:hypothetical protein
MPELRWKKFVDSAGLEITEGAGVDGTNLKECTFKLWNNSWNKPFVFTEIRMFLFRFYANTLKLNSRAAHFNPEINQSCYFCVKNKILPAPKESLGHFFWDCTISNKLVKYATKEIFGNIVLEKDYFFTGRPKNVNVLQSIAEQHLMFFNIMKYVLWEFKWAKKSPDNLSFAYRTKFFIDMIFKCSKQQKVLAINSNLFYLMQR